MGLWYWSEYHGQLMAPTATIHRRRAHCAEISEPITSVETQTGPAWVRAAGRTGSALLLPGTHVSVDGHTVVRGVTQLLLT